MVAYDFNLQFCMISFSCFFCCIITNRCDLDEMEVYKTLLYGIVYIKKFALHVLSPEVWTVLYKVRGSHNITGSLGSRSMWTTHWKYISIKLQPHCEKYCLIRRVPDYLCIHCNDHCTYTAVIRHATVKTSPKKGKLQKLIDFV